MPKIPTKAMGRYYLGIDPGQSGGMASIEYGGTPHDFLAFGSLTDHQIAEWLRLEQLYISKAALEQVNAMPGQGVCAMFTFGKSYGFLRGLLVAFQIPFIEVRPQVWQKTLAIPPKKDKGTTEHKRVLIAKAQERWPRYMKLITKATADAALIAEWLRLQEVKSA